jgi:putative AdoMet-dependent methyltransferase
MRAGISNIAFSHAGFLTYEHRDEPAAAITTTFALHHLPDLWKGIALARMRSILRPGRSALHPRCDPRAGPGHREHQGVYRQAVKGRRGLSQERCGRPFSTRISTYDWILDGLLSRTGCKVISKTIQDGSSENTVASRIRRVSSGS